MGAAFALLLAACVLRLGDGDRASFLWLNQHLSRPQHWSQGWWSAWSVAGLGASVFLLGLGLAASRAANFRTFVLALLASLPLGLLLTYGPKWLLNWPRPGAVLPPDQFQTIGEGVFRSATMPSGHALSVATLVTLLMLARPALVRKSSAGVLDFWRRAVGPAGWLGALLMVMLARIAVGAHWPSDVLAGAGLGLLVAGLAWTLGQKWEAVLQPRWGQALPPLMTGGLMAGLGAAGLALLLDQQPYPAGQPMWLALLLVALAGIGVALAELRDKSLPPPVFHPEALTAGDLSTATAGGGLNPRTLVVQTAALPGRRWQMLAGWVSPLFAVGLLASAVGADAGWQALQAALQSLPAWAWAFVLLGMWGSYALRAERMRREWSGWLLKRSSQAVVSGNLNGDVTGEVAQAASAATANQAAPTVPGAPAAALPSFKDCLGIFLNHNAALVLLPMRAGELGYPWMLKARWGVPLADSLRSLLWLRFQDALVLALAAGTLMLPWAWPVRLGLLAVVVLVTLWGLPALISALARRVEKGRQLLQALHEHADDRSGWLLCAANWVLKLAVLGVLLAWLGGISLNDGWRGAVGGELAGALPLQGPAGLGTYEAGIWAAVALGSAPPAGLVGAALAVHAAVLLCALVSAGLFRLLVPGGAQASSPGSAVSRTSAPIASGRLP